MTKEQLLKGLHKAVSYVDTMDYLKSLPEFEDKSEDEIAMMVAMNLYSDALLQYVNENLSFIPKIKFVVQGLDVSQRVLENQQDEKRVFMPLLHDKRAVCVEESDIAVMGCAIQSVICRQTFMDEDGNFFDAQCYSHGIVVEDTDEADDNSVTMYEKLEELLHCEMYGMTKYLNGEYADIWEY